MRKKYIQKYEQTTTQGEKPAKVAHKHKNTFYVQSIEALDHGHEIPGALGQRPTVAQDLGLNDVFMYLKEQ